MKLLTQSIALLFVTTEVQRRIARVKKLQHLHDLVSQMNVCDPTTEDRTRIMVVSREVRKREISQPGYDSDSSATLIVNVRPDHLASYNTALYRTMSGMIGSRLASRMLYYKLYIRSLVQGPPITQPRRSVLGVARLYEPTVMSSSCDEAELGMVD